MIQNNKTCYLSFFVLLTNLIVAQEISLFNQLNGRLDYTAIGNTLNTAENNSNFNCVINTTSSATLNLSNTQSLEAAYLYWAGSGSGDFNVSLNTIILTPDRTFEYSLDASRQFFAAFKDVTELIQTQGNGMYTLSDLEQIDISEAYCSTGTNFAGWAIIIIDKAECSTYFNTCSCVSFGVIQLDLVLFILSSSKDEDFLVIESN